MLKVVIRCQRLRKVALTHEDKAHGIAQRVCFVLPRKQQVHGLPMECSVNPYCFDIRIPHQVDDEGECGHAGQTPGIGQGHKLCQHIIVRQPTAGCVVQRARMGMERFGTIVEA